MEILSYITFPKTMPYGVQSFGMIVYKDGNQYSVKQYKINDGHIHNFDTEAQAMNFFSEIVGSRKILGEEDIVD